MPTSPGLVAVVGAPRSGTSWVQSVLGSHPRIASPQETDLFTRYIDPLDRAWRWQLRGDEVQWVERRLKGLPAVLDEREFVAIVRGFIDQVLDRVLALKPGSDIVLEKSPSHSLDVDTIARYVPETRFVHVVRDGRDVAASIRAAGRGWGRWWAPTDVAGAARLWRDHVVGARRAAAAPGGYLEVRYEELRTGGAPAFVDLFRFVGVDVDEGRCRELLDAHAIDATDAGGRDVTRSRGILVGGAFAHLTTADEPDGFRRTGEAGGWRHEWTAADKMMFALVAGDLLVELGDERDAGWAASSTRLRMFRLQRRARAALERRPWRRRVDAPSAASR